MCGIFCYICSTTINDNDIDSNEQCIKLIKSRGPDNYNEKLEKLSVYWHSQFCASVLWMQGKSLFPQPCTDNNGNILLWNGDIFSGSLVPNVDQSDTKAILDALEKSDDVISTLNEIKGPHSFIYYQKSTNFLFFGRDKIGRHSLLLKIDNSKTKVTITSVATKQMESVFEVPAIGTFALDLNNPKLHFLCYPWKFDTYHKSIIDEFTQILQTDVSIQQPNFVYTNLQAYNIPDNIDTIYSLEISGIHNMENIMEKLLENKEISENVSKLVQHLHSSIEIRLKQAPNYCKYCIQIKLCDENVECNHSKIGISFSGGLDSAVIAVIADKYVKKTESIDLINVAFERKIGSDYEVPDRITGRSTFSELMNICPQRKWNFIEVNITRKEIERTLPHIANLIYPLDTILDESVGCAVFFASKAKGTLYPECDPYESPSRVLLLGMGADELFGGYMRHRTILRQKGWAELVEELNHELERIWKRNLGRDDRIVSDNGRQGRYPYLDDYLVQFAQNLKPWQRCYPTSQFPCGLGDKMLLRLAARKLGLNKAANFPKRAFQFGSRIANSKENAKDKSGRL